MQNKHDISGAPIAVRLRAESPVIISTGQRPVEKGAPQQPALKGRNPVIDLIPPLRGVTRMSRRDKMCITVCKRSLRIRRAGRRPICCAGSPKGFIFITAGQRPAGRRTDRENCLKGRTVSPVLSLAFQATATGTAFPFRGSLTHGYENKALRATEIAPLRGVALMSRRDSTLLTVGVAEGATCGEKGKRVRFSLFFFPFLFLFYMLFFLACSGDTPEQEEEIIRYETAPGIVAISYRPCTDRQTVKVLENEPAIVRRNNIFQTEGEDISIHIEAANIDTFAFEIYNRYEGVMPRPLVSRYRVPEKYRIDGLEVKISGEITNCYVGLSAPNIKTMPQNIFELTSIDKRDPLTVALYDQDTLAIQQLIWGKWICAYGKGGLANIVHHHYDGYTFEFTADKQYIINNGKGKTEANTYYWKKYALYTGSSDSVYVMFPDMLLFEEIKNDTLIYSDPPMLMTDGITYYLIKAEN